MNTSCATSAAACSSLEGTRLRWKKWQTDETRADGGKANAVVLCQGSAVPGAGQGAGGLAVHRDCSTKDITLELGAIGSAWTIELEVFDSTNRSHTAVVRVDTEAAIG